MLIFYAQSTGGFYNSIDHADSLPEDAIRISDEEYRALFAAPFLNQRIESDGKGRPVLLELSVNELSVRMASEKSWRDASLAATDRLIARDRDEMDDGGGTTLDQTQYTQLQAYRRALRDWPQDEHFPAAEYRPVAPSWLAGHL
ncbi:phage tail assembly chaperone [Pseudomonas sp. SWRI12]|uniref:Phage tail assembly chaperone n=1 Tax=Pseudomonas zanjanensis TaxID=2745496 RepID=A0A923JJ90_9PSED|nr:phage tail assembly chaperone [Pseudomonas zanjanensis]MBV4493928.1 phage tail assembly chaperone [Pseudomonas zanjanensis]